MRADNRVFAEVQFNLQGAYPALWDLEACGEGRANRG
jgi:hypothetical protein